MFRPSLPGLSTLLFESVPDLPPTLAALLPGGQKAAAEARATAVRRRRVALGQALATRLYLHALVPTIEDVPAVVRRELAQVEASTWALLCYVQLCGEAFDAACEAGGQLLEHLPSLPSPFQVFGARLVKALLISSDHNGLLDDIEHALSSLHERDRDAIGRLVRVQRAILMARRREFPAALSALREVTQGGNDSANMAAWYTMARIYESAELAWEEMESCLRWRDALRLIEPRGVGAYAGWLAEKNVDPADVVDMGLRLVGRLRSAGRHPEAEALIQEFESAGFGDRASVLRSQEPRADGWSVRVVSDASGQGNALARAEIYGQLVGGRTRHACIGVRRAGYDEPAVRVVDPDSDPMPHLISELPDMLEGVGLEVVPHVLTESVLTTYRWLLLREQETPMSGLLVGLLATKHGVTSTVVQCIAFDTRIDEERNKEWLAEAMRTLSGEFDTNKRREVVYAVDRVLQRLAPTGTRVSVIRI